MIFQSVPKQLRLSINDQLSKTLKIAIAEILDISDNLELDFTLATALAGEKLIIGIASVLCMDEKSSGQSVSSRVEYRCKRYGPNSSSSVYHIKHGY